MFTGIDPHGEVYLLFLHNRLTVVLHFALVGPVYMDVGHYDHTALVAGQYIPTAVAMWAGRYLKNTGEKPVIVGSCTVGWVKNNNSSLNF